MPRMHYTEFGLVLFILIYFITGIIQITYYFELMADNMPENFYLVEQILQRKKIDG